MFEALKGAAGLAGLMKDLPRIKAKMEHVRQELERLEVDGSSGGGAVRVVATGKLRIKSISIDQPLMQGLLESSGDEGTDVAAGLITEGVNDALENAQAAAARAIQEAASDLDLPIPPSAITGLLS